MKQMLKVKSRKVERMDIEEQSCSIALRCLVSKYLTFELP